MTVSRRPAGRRPSRTVYLSHHGDYFRDPQSHAPAARRSEAVVCGIHSRPAIASSPAALGDERRNHILSAIEHGRAEGGRRNSSGRRRQRRHSLRPVSCSPRFTSRTPKRLRHNESSWYSTAEPFTRAAGSLASKRRFLGTFTAPDGTKVDVDDPQPALWTLGPIEKQGGSAKFPVLAWR